MRKLIFVWMVLLFVCFANISCGKADSGCTPATVASERATLISYCTTNTINYIEHSSGILYEVINPGTGANPTTSSRVYITYTGKLFNGTVFDAQTNPTGTGWVLNTLIDGWKIGLPLIKKGGRIKLVIPSSLAYGCAGNGNIPSNTPLFFDVTLVDVQ
ncbi:MAG: FKBP-type peptidyl-prolyl cis-trans isomerase [Chitinophagaceae bacterium]|nr:FKBP-type peptidyl-prolyl cis-trans isomerase [Chitinophagaceae bacterium]